jgi:hypothetical protein
MPPRKAKKGEVRTWEGLEEPDVTGADEAEAEQMIEFGRRSKTPEQPEKKERRCRRKPKR